VRWSGTPVCVAEGAESSTRLLVAFARALRGAGLIVPVDSVVHYLRAVEALGIDRRDPVYWAGRTVLVHRHEDAGIYDRTFDAFWWGRTPWPELPVETAELSRNEELDGLGVGPAVPTDAPAPPVTRVSYSAQERLRYKDFASCTPQELDEIARLLRDVRLRALRRSRRMRRSTRDHGRHDARSTVRRSLRTGGEVVRLVRREPKSRPRRIVLLCDVSGSMEPYSRMLLRFLHVAVVGHGRVEAFAVGTRLTRLTRQLSSRDPDAALASAAAEVLDWSGGTRLGEGIGTFNDRFGMPGMARGAVVVVLSDGWDRGDPARLAEEMARLHRAAYRTVWVNPLKASEGYQPLARGMAAALPHVDQFVEGHSAASLEALVHVIAQ
jgi:uncharacterized protein with von Willebrand factor type A (vWA) domain